MRTTILLLRALIVTAAVAIAVLRFVAIDANSHSNSDTLRPFLLTIVPLWLVALWAARIVLRER